MKLLNGKVALITGASSGIGRAIAVLFAQHGASLILNARNQTSLAELEALLRASGTDVKVFAGDAGEQTTHTSLAAIATEAFGGIDIAVNNAGTTGAIRPLAEITPDEWHHTLKVNLTAGYLGARSQVPLMLNRGGGSLIFISSFVGTSVGLPGMTAYAAAKAGLMGLVKGLTADYAVQGIRANALLPGGTETRMAGDDAQRAWAAGLHAMKRLAQPEEIASAALFLASSMSGFVAGSALFADGGNAAVK
jgi:NAD(P)-dependent dehydrogenase (short-subunit alcohol dehydrogenase family)